MSLPVVSRWWTRLRGRMPGNAGGGSHSPGLTYIELAIMMLIFSILIISITTAIQVASRGNLSHKERLRALTLARERLEEVKNMGYSAMLQKPSNYYYPEVADPRNPLTQDPRLPPYPATAPSPGDDPWTPETILVGRIAYWRHVVVKFVTEPVSGDDLRQSPLQDPPPPCTPCPSPTEVGGTSPGSHLAWIEVAVTWFSRRLGRMQQIRVSSLLADPSVPSLSTGSIMGTVYNDDSDRDGTDEGSPGPTLPASGAGGGPTVDDRPVTAGVIIFAQNVSDSTKSYSTTVGVLGADRPGQYELRNLPDGSYYVDLRGGPMYKDSSYTSKTSMPFPPTLPRISVVIDSSNKDLKEVNVWTMPANQFNLIGRYTGVTGSMTTTTFVEVNVGDIRWTTSLNGGWVPGGPQVCGDCWFTLSGLSWPSTGFVPYKVTITAVTDGVGTSATGYIYVEAGLPPQDFYIGVDSSVYNSPSNPCPPGSGTTYNQPDCFKTSNTPDTGNPPSDKIAWQNAINLAMPFSPATVRIKMRESVDFGDLDLAGVDGAGLSRTSMGRVRMTIGSLMSSTVLAIDANGLVVFDNVAPTGIDADIKFTAFMTTTGYTTDDFFLPFKPAPGGQYNLEPFSLIPPSPIEELRHLFVVTRVSAVSGTVWAIAGTKAFPDANVEIRNDLRQWSSLAKANSEGEFTLGSVPKDTNPYTIRPLAGSDYVASPIYRSLMVSAPGHHFAADDSLNPIEFTLTAINGHLKGTVYLGSAAPANLVKEGALVIASTYNTGSQQFVTSLPDANLTGDFSYSTVTLTDGTYKMKVATGVGAYWVYVSAVINGVEVFVKSAAAVSVPADTEVSQDMILP